MTLEELRRRTEEAQRAVGRIVGIHEDAPTRVLELRQSFEKVKGLPVDVSRYYTEALRALQVGCFRAAMVFAWAGFIYMLTAKLVQGYQAELKQHYGSWNHGTTEELLESAKEFQIIDAAKKCGLIKNQKVHIYKGWLSTRNQCAHPTLYDPGRNASLGYVDRVIAEVALYL